MLKDGGRERPDQPVRAWLHTPTRSCLSLPSSLQLNSQLWIPVCQFQKKKSPSAKTKPMLSCIHSLPLLRMKWCSVHWLCCWCYLQCIRMRVLLWCLWETNVTSTVDGRWQKKRPQLLQRKRTCLSLRLQPWMPPMWLMPSRQLWRRSTK